jgi:ribosomal protein L16 Arg81 hydroxylase
MIVPLSTGEWLLSFWDAHQEARRSPDPRLRPLECIAEEGEVIFVPNGWWHMVVNLEDCIALTQNYCSTSNLSACLRFFREKVDQISGVRDRAEEAIQPDDMYEEFIKGLRLELPSEVLEKAIADSFVNKVTIVPKRTIGRLKLFDKESVSSKKQKRTSSAYDSQIVEKGIVSTLSVTKAPEEFSFGFHFSA